MKTPRMATAYVTEDGFLLCPSCLDKSTARVRANADPRPLAWPDTCDRCDENIPTYTAAKIHDTKP